MTLTHIDLISVPVSDQTVSKLFYTEKLGFEVIKDAALGEGRRWIQLGLPGARTTISLVTWLDHMPPGSKHGTMLCTDDIDAAHANLTDHGLMLTDIESAPWGRHCAFHDPDNNGWLLVQRPAA